MGSGDRAMTLVGHDAGGKLARARLSTIDSIAGWDLAR